MRVELIYTPGCNSYKRTLELLETVIAEERLPIPVELVESGHLKPSVVALRINGQEQGQSTSCKHEHASAELSAIACIDNLRELLSRKWQELTQIA